MGTIVVSKEYQKTGTGQALMSKIEEWAAAEGAEEIDLNVMHFNSNAFEFYKKSGFEEVFTRMAKKI